MPAMLSPVWIRGRRAAAAVCAICLLGAALASSAARAQVDEGARVPWQAYPGEGQQIPPPDCAVRLRRAFQQGWLRRRVRWRVRWRVRRRMRGTVQRGVRCHALVLLARYFAPRGQLTFRAEYLAWWTKSASLPALATTSPSGTPRSEAGVLGEPGTSVLFGGSDGDQRGRSGAALVSTIGSLPATRAASR